MILRGMPELNSLTSHGPILGEDVTCSPSCGSGGSPALLCDQRASSLQAGLLDLFDLPLRIDEGRSGCFANAAQGVGRDADSLRLSTTNVAPQWIPRQHLHFPR